MSPGDTQRGTVRGPEHDDTTRLKVGDDVAVTARVVNLYDFDENAGWCEAEVLVADRHRMLVPVAALAATPDTPGEAEALRQEVRHLRTIRPPEGGFTSEPGRRYVGDGCPAVVAAWGDDAGSVWDEDAGVTGRLIAVTSDDETANRIADALNAAGRAATGDTDPPRKGDRVQQGDQPPGTVLDVQTDTYVQIAWDDANGGPAEWIELDDWTDLGLTLVRRAAGDHPSGAEQ